MPIFILYGYLIGLGVGIFTAITFAHALALPVPSFLAGIAALLAPLSPIIAFLFAALALIFFYLVAYAIATLSVIPLFPPGVFPPVAPVATTSGLPVPLAASSGEFFARGMMIGESVVLNAIPLSAIPRYGLVLSIYAAITISLAAIIFVARNRVYQGFLGWSAWLFPLSYLATAVGALLFVVNAPIAFALGGIGAFRVDFTTGVIETAGGLPTIVAAGAGIAFSLGNFTFIIAPGAASSFTAPSVSTHETGHTLNTAACGGVVLWINAVDENVRPFRKFNLAYGELLAESHAASMPGMPVRARFFVPMW